jgi:hypothetical protein
MVDVPSSLLRAFACEQYAMDFIAGRMRFGLLSYYRGIEDARRDETEGSVSFSWNLKANNPDAFNVHYSGSSLNAHYLLCASHPEVPRKLLAQRFGPFIVSINKPLELLKRILEVWDKDERSVESPAGWIAPVEYTKGELIDPDPYLLAPPHLCYSQKPRLYAEEHEYRYVLRCQAGVKEDDFLMFDLTDCRDIACLMEKCPISSTSSSKDGNPSNL